MDRIPQTPPVYSLPLTRVYAVIVALWTLLVLGTLVWELHKEEGEMMERAYSEVQSNYNKDMTFRRWSTRHGGVYVPVTETQRPVPWLAHVPDRDIRTPGGQPLTLLNPASMVRQMTL